MPLPLAAIVPRTLDVVDYILLAVYFAVNLGIGWWCSRRKQSSGSFFLGGGRGKVSLDDVAEGLFQQGAFRLAHVDDVLGFEVEIGADVRIGGGDQMEPKAKEKQEEYHP